MYGLLLDSGIYRQLTPWKVADCSVSLVDDVDKTKFGFVIRFVQLTRIIERSFHTEAADERQEWVDAIVEVANFLLCTSTTLRLTLSSKPDLKESMDQPRLQYVSTAPCLTSAEDQNLLRSTWIISIL